MNKKLCLTLAMFVLHLFVYSQSFIISGSVVSADGQDLPGVYVIVEGSSNGTTTDFDGYYSLKVQKGKVLLFSHIGFNSKKIVVGDSTKINVVLESGLDLDEFIVTGNRYGDRTSMETAVPVDVIDVKTIRSVGAQTEINQIMNYSIPSFTSNTQTISDGTDAVDPASLRGLGPDQVLVLIEGKRRHGSSLINVNGTFGRGSVGTDMNTIPSEAISSIQVLRDGAAAQYGSDAVAGVINILLKENTNKLSINISNGANLSKQSNALEGGEDGYLSNLALNYGISVGKRGGFVNFTGEFLYRDYYNRAGIY